MSDNASPRRRLGIRDVAEAAGVSVTTVSHALSGARAVRPATRDRILREAARLGYRPDPRASGLRRDRSYILGLVGDRVISSPHGSRMMLGAQGAAATHGSVVVGVDAGGDPAVEEQQIRSLLDHRVDGVVYARMFHQIVRVPASLGDLPVVLLDARTADRRVSSIVPDERGIAATAVRHLLEHGHRAVAFATTADRSPAAISREHGFHDELARAGAAVDDATVVRCTADAEGGRSAGLRLLGAAHRPTAVFCFNDQIAMGIYQAATALGLSVPDDVSVIGIDNLPFVADGLDPGLTTVALPHEEMGRWAVERLLERIETPGEHGAVQVALPCQLVRRGSVAPPRVSGGPAGQHGEE